MKKEREEEELLILQKQEENEKLLKEKEYLQIINNNKEIIETLTSERDKYKFENTKVTLAMVAKYYLQIFLILLVHSFVFWYFPINGNIKL